VSGLRVSRRRPRNGRRSRCRRAPSSGTPRPSARSSPC